MHFPIYNRHCLARMCQHHPDVRRHVVAAFGIVAEVMGIFWNQTFEKLLQIPPCRRIGIFHDHNAATGVLNKNSRSPILNAVLVDLRLDVVGDFVEAFTLCPEFELIVVNVHSEH